MKKKDFSEIKTKDIKALKKIVMDKKFEIAKNFKTSSKKMRKDIAMIMTLIKEKEILERIQK